MRFSRLAIGLALACTFAATPSQAQQSGAFEIRSALAPNVCLHALGPIAPGVHLGVGPCDGAPDSRFYQEGSTVLLGALCLDAGSGGDAAPVLARTCDGTGGQSWSFSPGDRTLRAGTGRCVEVQEGHTITGTPVLLSGWHKAPSQQWDREPLGRRIQALSEAGTCLKVLGEIGFHAPVGVLGCDNEESSLFVFDEGRLEVGEMCLGANEARQVIVVPCTAPEVRIFRRDPDDTIRSDGLCLDHGHARISVALWACDGTPGQRWRYDVPPPRQHGLPERPGGR